MRDAIDYLVAIGRHWRTLITGGSTLVGAVVVLQYITGWQVAQPVGIAIVVVTLFRASFLAWNVERAGRVVSVAVTGYVAPRGVMDGYPLTVFALLTNRSKEPRGVRWGEWFLDIASANGDAIAHLAGHLKGELAPIGSEQQFSVEILFPVPAKPIPRDATLRLHGEDIHGGGIETEFAAAIGSARPHVLGIGLPRIRAEVAHEIATRVPRDPGKRATFWGLRIINDGSAAVFEATVRVVSGVTTGADPARVYRLSFARSDALSVKIFTGGEERLFFGLAWDIPLYNDGLVGKELWFYDDHELRNYMLPMVPTAQQVVLDPGRVTAELEVTITSDPAMEEPWRRVFRFGPGNELTAVAVPQPSLIQE
jgi:hypothetical protein